MRKTYRKTKIYLNRVKIFVVNSSGILRESDKKSIKEVAGLKDIPLVEKNKLPNSQGKIINKEIKIMNKGVIYKIKIEESGNIKYCIRLDRNVKIEDKEYNIYVDKNKKDNNYANAATLFSVDREFDLKIPLPVCTGKKYNFELKIEKPKEENRKEVGENITENNATIKITSIEEKLIGND